MRTRADHRAAARCGRRVVGRSVVLHFWVQPAAPTAPAVVGFAVGRSIGPAVVRNRIRRRLRHLMRSRGHDLPAGGRLLVRVRPEATTATSLEMGQDLDRCLARLKGGGT